jgi:hypothetical protein
LSDDILEEGTEEEVEALQGLLGGQAEDEDKEPPPRATLDQLKKKQRVTKTVTVNVTGDDGDPMEVSLSFRGIPAQQYDKLISRFPPLKEHKKQGYQYNPDKFGPALIAATCVDPEITEEDAKEIWESDNWNRGERMMLMMAAIEVCTVGLNVPFKKSASA